MTLGRSIVFQCLHSRAAAASDTKGAETNLPICGFKPANSNSSISAPAGTELPFILSNKFSVANETVNSPVSSIFFTESLISTEENITKCGRSAIALK